MESYYTTLGVAKDATIVEIEFAYHRLREAYNHERVAGMDDELAQVARTRLTALDRAYETLSDAQRRVAYDASLSAPRRVQRAGLSRRELGMLVGGALVGLLLIVAVWQLAGRSTTPTISMARLDRPAPAFSLRGLDGGTLQLDDFGNKKLIMVNFWYSNCAPCQEETPALQQAYQKLQDDGLVIIGVNVRANERRGIAGDDDVRAFIERYGVSYPIGFDDQGQVSRAYQVLPLPSTFFIDTSGTIRYASYTTVTVEDVERVFNELQRGATAAR